MILEFISTNWTSVVLSLITAGALAFCRWTWKQMKDYQQLLEDKEKEELTKTIDDEIDRQITPVIDQIEEIRDYIRKNNDSGVQLNNQMNLIIASYRFRLIQLCKIYLREGSITIDQYEQLTEFYRLYEGLGGNGQAKDFYEKAIALPKKAS